MPCPFRSGARKSVASRQESRVRNQTRRAHAVLVLLTANIWLLTRSDRSAATVSCRLGRLGLCWWKLAKWRNGRRTRLKIERGNPCGFDSHLGHFKKAQKNSEMRGAA